jgi:hypothetical protein
VGPGWRFAAGGGGGWDGAFDVRAVDDACVDVAGDGRDGYWRVALVAALAARDAGLDADEPMAALLLCDLLRL